MRQYNDTARALVYALLPTLALVAGCASSGGTEPEASGSPDTGPAAAESAPRDSGVSVERTPAEAEPRPAVRDDAPRRYTVKKGDTLWDIAGYFLDDPWYWPELWYANPEIDNPHLIYPGDVLELIWVDGKPRLRRAETERLSPQVRELPIEAAVPTIPLDAIRQFLEGPRMVTPEELENAPYIVQFLDEHLIGGAGTEIYVRKAEPEDGRLLEVVRPGGPYRDPETGEILGYEAIPIGTAEILEFADIATGTLTQTNREALIGDRLLPLQDEKALASDFYPHAPDQAVDGRIISVFDGVAEIGQYEIVAINRGEDQAMERGHVLDIFQVGRQARDPITGEQLTLPALQAGTLMVFEVEKRVAFGLVMTATRAIHVGDSVRAPGSD